MAKKKEKKEEGRKAFAQAKQNQTPSKHGLYLTPNMRDLTEVCNDIPLKTR